MLLLDDLTLIFDDICDVVESCDVNNFAMDAVAIGFVSLLKLCVCVGYVVPC